MIRLLRALEATRPASLADFFGLAALQIRRELLDLARHHFGPEGSAANRVQLGETKAGTEHPAWNDPADSSCDPDRLSLWSAFHEVVETLPANERSAVDLLWYHGLGQAEAAALLGVSVPTVKRWWLSARLRLKEALGDVLPQA